MGIALARPRCEPPEAEDGCRGGGWGFREGNEMEREWSWKKTPRCTTGHPHRPHGNHIGHWGLQRRTREKTRGKPMVHHESGLIRDSRGCMASMASMASPNSVQPRVGVTDPPLPSSGARPPEMSRSFRAWRGMAEDLPSECLWLT